MSVIFFSALPDNDYNVLKLQMANAKTNVIVEFSYIAIYNESGVSVFFSLLSHQ